MHSLRLKFALIRIGAAVTVVLIATIATWLMVSIGDAERMVPPMAHHMVTIANETDPEKQENRPPRRAAVRDTPAQGMLDAKLSDELTKALAARGLVTDVYVTRSKNTGNRKASLKLSNSTWMIFSFLGPPPTPPDFWVALSAWITIFVSGIIAIALSLAQRITQPFVMLEQAVVSVGTNGVLPHTPVNKSGEARRMATVLNQLSERLKSAIESRMRLVAAAGHDLRTPITRLRIRVEFLPDEERNDWISDLEAIADNAIRLVHEESTTENQVPLALESALNDIVHEVVASKLPAKLISTVPATIAASPLSLRRALRNLVINAATHRGGASVKLICENDTAIITIEDNGPGIPDARMAQVFEPFFRAAPGRTRTMKGAGLGLAIAKEIIERYNGTIEISNRNEGGLRQIISLPTIPAPR